MNGFAKLILPFLVLTLSITSCKSPSEKDASKITALEEELKDEARPDKEKLDKLLESYTTYVEQYPDDSIAPIYLYRAVNLCMGRGDGQKAMLLIDKSINKYPNGPRFAETVFLKAYVYENFLGKYGTASQIYRDFINRFPGHELADDAQIAIQNMGKSPDELVREFEAKAAEEKANLQSGIDKQ